LPWPNDGTAATAIRMANWMSFFMIDS